MEIIYDGEEAKLSKVLAGYGIGYNSLMKLLRKKDIKINGKRVCSDIDVSKGATIIVYGMTQTSKKHPAPVIVFCDDNILVINKPAGIESCGTDSMEELLISEGYNCYAVHRLDRNTTGLIIFARNQQAKTALEQAFKHRKIRKIYRAELVGKPKRDQAVLEAYLRKDADQAMCYVSDTPLPGYVPIKTSYKIINRYPSSAIVEIELFTGRTHQIRAHMAHIGYPVAGDGKYGDYEYNKRNGYKYQRLCAVKIIFENVDGFLGYLKGKAISIDWD